MKTISSTLIIVDDDGLDNFITNKLINAKYPQTTIISFQSMTKAFDFVKHLDIVEQRYILLLDLYIAPHLAWDFLEAFEQLPQDFQSAFDIYMMSSSPEQKNVDKAAEYKIVKDFFKKPIREEQLYIMLDND
jgi:response regulator of citrate/malate metabolism